jgi:hypothetical protein
VTTAAAAGTINAASSMTSRWRMVGARRRTSRVPTRLILCGRGRKGGAPAHSM